MTTFSFSPIGYIRSCFTEKFGIPRQPGLVSEAIAYLDLIPPFTQKEAFRGLEEFSHLWIIFVFHANGQYGWKPTVRPPCLGGNRRIGVFASRSPYRPNNIGQSVVSLTAIEMINGAPRLKLSGVDLMDGTPVLDVKPYLTYADSIPQARYGWARTIPQTLLHVRWSTKAIDICRRLDPDQYPDIENLITALLARDPRPAYIGASNSRTYGMKLWDINIRFTVSEEGVLVEDIEIG